MQLNCSLPQFAQYPGVQHNSQPVPSSRSDSSITRTADASSDTAVRFISSTSRTRPGDGVRPRTQGDAAGGVDRRVGQEGQRVGRRPIVVVAGVFGRSRYGGYGGSSNWLNRRGEELFVLGAA